MKSVSLIILLLFCSVVVFGVEDDTATSLEELGLSLDDDPIVTINGYLGFNNPESRRVWTVLEKVFAEYPVDFSLHHVAIEDRAYVKGLASVCVRELHPNKHFDFINELFNGRSVLSAQNTIGVDILDCIDDGRYAEQLGNEVNQAGDTHIPTIRVGDYESTGFHSYDDTIPIVIQAIVDELAKPDDSCTDSDLLNTTFRGEVFGFFDGEAYAFIDYCTMNGTAVGSCTDTDCTLVEYSCAGNLYTQNDFTCNESCSEGSCGSVFRSETNETNDCDSNSPVCGSDNTTYLNACSAEQAGVSYAEGFCDSCIDCEPEGFSLGLSTCFDGILNSDEERIDCGGSCQECVCDGCLVDTECLAYGRTLEFNGTTQYCDFNSAFSIQKQENVTCAQHFECESFLCLDGVCSDFEEEQEVENVLSAFISWFSSLFTLQ